MRFCAESADTGLTDHQAPSFYLYNLSSGPSKSETTSRTASHRTRSTLAPETGTTEHAVGFDRTSGLPALSTSLSPEASRAPRPSTADAPNPPGRPHACLEPPPAEPPSQPGSYHQNIPEPEPSLLLSPGSCLCLCPSVYSPQAQRGLRKRKSDAFKTVPSPPCLPMFLPSASPPTPTPPLFLLLPPPHLCPQH